VKGGETQAAAKKQCGGGRKSKAKVVPTKDPQSAVAKVQSLLVSPHSCVQDLLPSVENSFDETKLIQGNRSCF
jgi:hypothetical protein